MSVVQDVLSWWGSQLRDLLPARLRGGGLVGDAVIAEMRPGQPLTILRRRGRTETPLGRLDAPQMPAQLKGSKRLLLRVPRGCVLERGLHLPLATEPQLDRVLGYEVDRISPFGPEEVALAYTIERRDREAGRLHLRVALLPRAPLAPALDALRAQRLVPQGVLAPREDGGTWWIGLAPPGQRAATPWRRPVLGMSTACAVLALAAAALPFVRQEMALSRTESRIAALRPAVDLAEGLRRRIADRANGIDAVASEGARVGQALTVLGTITTLLPDDTWLTSFSLRQRAVTLSGRSASAARLIPLLSADPAIRDATFTAPVTRAEGGNGDLFSIRAEFGS